MPYWTHHPRKQLLFGLLSAADLSLTGWLLRLPGGRVYEANPVARWWLERHGWLGLAGFKAGLVLLVAALAVAISRRRPRAGGRVLAFGCAALALVVLHSAVLGRDVLGSPEVKEALARQQQYQKLEGNFRTIAEFEALRDRLAEDLVAGRGALGEAVEKLAATEKGRDPSWLLDPVGQYAGLSPRERLAANLILFAALRAEPPHATGPVVRRLGHQFRLTFNRPLPDRFYDLLPDSARGGYDGGPDGPGPGAGEQMS